MDLFPDAPCKIKNARAARARKNVAARARKNFGVVNKPIPDFQFSGGVPRCYR
jgi:hypothetical protein